MLHIQTNRKTKRTAKKGRREKRRVIVEFAVIFTRKNEALYFKSIRFEQKKADRLLM